MLTLCPISSTLEITSFFYKKEKDSRKEQTREHKWQQETVNLLTTPLLSAVLTLSSPILGTIPGQLNITSIAQVEPPKGAALFQKSCIGCHDMGGNILQPGATLFRKDLERNGLVTEEDIYNITYYGKGRMPGFGEKCAPRGQCTFGPRLQEEEIRQLAEFVKLQTERGWPNVETNVD
ncbi:hypothetical protein KSP39_PZI002240 [Platanthera zijinensis]|uniref:Cytochrome c-553 n=1 Tax=Platanthera zijinensis TaxID=2320716 RepID=A0AAP0BYN8_9ASPA